MIPEWHNTKHKRIETIMEQDRLRKLAGMSGKTADPEVMVQGFGGIPLSDAVNKIKQDAEKLDASSIQKADVLFIRNAAAAIAQLFDDQRPKF